MIRTLVLDPKTDSVIESDIRGIELWNKDPDKILWIDIQDEPENIERRLLEDDFGLHPLAVDDALLQRRPPKIEVFNNHVFILLRGLDKDTDNIHFGVIQLSMFIGERFILTRHNKDSISTDALWDEVLQTYKITDESSDALAIRLFNRVIGRFLKILLSLEPRLDELEQYVFENPDDSLLAELTQYKSSLRQLHRIAQYHLQIAEELRNNRPGRFGKKLRHEIINLYERLERSRSLAELYYAMASDLIDGFLAIAAHRLNRIMRILTIFTVTFVPLTFLAGIYGMNFDNMPELHSDYGYFIVIGIMFSTLVVMLLYFRVKKWM